MTKILLVRHGQSVWNAQGRWQGQADPPLSDLGRRQADAAGKHLTSWPRFDGIASSTLDRAATTADLINAHLDVGEPYRTSYLAERDVGEWGGLTREQIDEQFPGDLEASRRPPGYEDDGDFLARIFKGLADLATNVPGDNLVVVAHGGLVYCLETSIGTQFRHLPNLNAIRFTIGDDSTITIDDRFDLLLEFDGETTIPRAL